MTAVQQIPPGSDHSFTAHQKQPFKLRLAGPLYGLFGLLFCFIVALICAKLFVHSPWAQYVPLGFVVVLVFVAAQFGAMVSFLGAVVAVLVFAYSLYPPLGSLRVADATARESLSWMLLSVLAISFLLFPSEGSSRH
jgi:K+-sensing histidine kinase KdpD